MVRAWSTLGALDEAASFYRMAVAIDESNVKVSFVLYRVCIYFGCFNVYSVIRSIYWNLWCGKKERWFQMALRNSSAYFPAETGNKYGVGKCPFDTREMVCHKICFFVCSYILKDSVYTLCIDLYIGICSECYFERCWICDPTADRC